MGDVIDAGRALLGLGPRPSEREKIEGETDLGRAEATLARLVEECAAVEEKLRGIPDADVNRRNPIGARVGVLRQTVIPAARVRVHALHNAADKLRREEGHAARVKADPLLREVDEAGRAVREADVRFAPVDALVSGRAGDRVAVPTGEGLVLLREQHRDLGVALDAAKRREAEARARLKERDDAEPRALVERDPGVLAKSDPCPPQLLG